MTAANELAEATRHVRCAIDWTPATVPDVYNTVNELEQVLRHVDRLVARLRNQVALLDHADTDDGSEAWQRLERAAANLTDVEARVEAAERSVPMVVNELSHIRSASKETAS